MTGARISDPQQWNMYTYTRNNPLQFVDPDGKDIRLAHGADVDNLIRVLASAYTKSDFRPMFNQLASSKNSFVVTNADILQDPNKNTVEEGNNVPKGTDPDKPVSDTNPMSVDTITLDNHFVLGEGVTNYGHDFVVGHEFDHAVDIDRNPVDAIKRHNDPQGQKAQEDAANKKGEKVGTEKSSMTVQQATEAVKKALGCTTSSTGTTTCK
jgi:hypothetical protein